jgi:hypothetical protein
MLNMVDMDVVLIQRQHALESVTAKRRFAVTAALDSQQQQSDEQGTKLGGAVRKLADLLRSPAGTLSSAGTSGQ